MLISYFSRWMDKMSSFETLVPNTPAGRFDGINRTFTAQDVEKLRGSVPIDYTLARRGALKLWELLKTEPYINALGALSGNQAMQMVRAGLRSEGRRVGKKWVSKGRS